MREMQGVYHLNFKHHAYDYCCDRIAMPVLGERYYINHTRSLDQSERNSAEPVLQTYTTESWNTIKG